jgi:ABC-2 type transport system permease protein
VGFGLIGEYRDGVIEAERVTPASRTALLLGRVLKDTLQVFVQGAVLIGLGFVFGLRGSIPGMLLGFVLALALTMAVAAAGYALALTVKTEDALAAVANGVTLPILLLSGILLPMTIAPQWLQTVSDFVPIKHIVQGIRDLFVGDIWTTGTLWAVVWTIILVVAGLWIGTRTFRRQNA